MSVTESEIIEAHRAVAEQERVLSDLRARRDAVFRVAVGEGVTMYRIAKLTGLTPPAVKKALAEKYDGVNAPGIKPQEGVQLKNLGNGSTSNDEGTSVNWQVKILS